MNNQVSLPYKTTGKTVLMYTLILTFLDIKMKKKDSTPNDSKYFPA